MRIIPNCRTCGLCCSPLCKQPTFCDIGTDAELKKLPRDFVKRNVVRTSAFDRVALVLSGSYVPAAAIKTKDVLVRTGPAKGATLTVCAALRGSPMNKVSCAIYNNRPDTCRSAVVPGDGTCLNLRNMCEQLEKRGHNSGGK